jgi:hypothetical protein
MKNKIYIFIFLSLTAILAVIFVPFHQKKVEVKDQKVSFNSFDQAQKIKEVCKKEKSTCYSSEFLTLAKSQGYENSFNTLLEIQKIDPTTNDCHLIAHSIGRGAYERDPENWKETVKKVDDSCYYGIFHGLIESYIFETGQQLNKQTIENICPFFTSPDCYHVMGHILILNEGGDLKNSLDSCNVIFDGEVSKLNDCMAGVFMEYQLPEGLYNHGLADKEALDTNKRLPGFEKMCSSYKGDTKVMCWLEIAHSAVAVYNNDIIKVFDECNKAGELRSIDLCLRHALQIVWAAKKYQLMDFVNFCGYNNKHDSNFERYCNDWVIGNSVFVLNAKKADILPFCEAIKNEYQSNCYQKVGKAVSS